IRSSGLQTAVMLSLPKAQLGLYDTSVFFEMRAYVCSLPDQAPSSWKGRAKCGTDVNVVVEIPDRCLASGWIVKQIIRTPVTVKVSRSHQRPPTGNGRPISASDQRSP